MELEIGAIFEGKVTGITKFGAFVALPGGRSGLVHISEVAYSYVSDVSEFLAVGQDVKVKVINIDDNNRINLSIKQTLPPPPKQERVARPDRGERNERGERSFNGDRAPRRDNNRGERPFNGNRGERTFNGDRDANRDSNRGERSFNGNRDNNRGGFRSSAPRTNTPKEPQGFDDMLKQYMSESETKLSQLNRGERPRRRGNRRGNGGGGSNW